MKRGAKQKTDEPMIGLDRLGEPIIDPAPDKPPSWQDSPTGKATWKGAKWGMVAGFAVAQIFISYGSIDTPFGSIYNGNIALVFIFWIGIGSALGAGIAWLNMQKIGEDDDVPPPTFPREPFG
jgi:hypothetical protein